MTAITSTMCRRAPCSKLVPSALKSEQLCLDHFLDEAFVRTNYALEVSRMRHPLDPSGMKWMLSDALAVVKSLEENAEDPNPEQRERMLELLLILSNLHEYAAQRTPTRVDRLA